MRNEENKHQILEKLKNVLIRNLGFNEEKVQQKFGKCHRVEPVKDDQQTTIMPFKSCKFKKKVYKKRKTPKNKKNKMKPSLTKTHTKTLSYAHEVKNTNLEIINFAFADPNGNLKFRLENSINWKSVFSFRNMNEIYKMIIDFGWKRPGEEIDESNNIKCWIGIW